MPRTKVVGIPPMPDGFTDRSAWDAIHFRFAGNGSALDQAMIGWQREQQERVQAAVRARELSECPE